jgi:hypothetical protein
MRLPRPRITVRRMMAAVLAVAVALHLGVTAYRVSGAGRHVHASIIIEHYIPPRSFGGIRVGGVNPVTHPGGVPSTYFGLAARSWSWVRFMRALVGLPWKGPGLCCKAVGEFEECELEHPEICERPSPYQVRFKLSARQRIRYDELKERARFWILAGSAPKSQAARHPSASADPTTKIGAQR